MNKRKKLRTLAACMNKQNVQPIPITKELLNCFDLVISPEETSFLLRLGTEPHTYQQAASLTDLTEEQFRPFFETQLKKGLVWMKRDEHGKELFSLAPILVGWFEVYLSDGGETSEKKEFSKRVAKLFKSWRKLNFFPLRNLLNYWLKTRFKPRQSILPVEKPRKSQKTITIEVNQTIEAPPAKVYPARTVADIIEKCGNKNKIALMHCFCRQWHKMAGEPCRFNLPAETCMVIGSFAEHIIRYGIGRLISREKALEVIQQTQEAGAVHQVFHEREDFDLSEIAICNCCWDCCGILGSYNRGIIPLYLKSYYYAQNRDDSSCNGCGICAGFCPVEAISIINGRSVINTRKCIGCGQCELQCPEDAIDLIFKEREVILPLKKKSEARIRSI